MVVGSGHNALVAACYLAREGLDVEVVERDTVIGGAVSTVERFPGYLMDRGSSAHIMVRHTGIVEELRLNELGLRYCDLDPWGFYPIRDSPGGGIVFWVDLERTCASIAEVCGPRDADAYRGFVLDWGRRNEQIFVGFQHPPTGRKLGRALWSVGKGSGLPGVELARQFLSPGDALLDTHFDDERLKTALSWLGAQSGPPSHEVATADLVGWNSMMHKRAPGHPVGGSGALTVALAARLASYGGVLRTGDAVVRITTNGSGTDGVLTESGERIRARTVLAGCHILTTLGLAIDVLPSGLLDRATRTIRVGNGIGMVVRLATSDLPRYPGAGPEVTSALQLITPSRDALRLAHGEFAAGLPPSKPAALAMSFSALDPTIAPPGKHNVTVWGQWHPYELSNGETWDAIGEREGDKLIDAVEVVAPGFAGSVQQVHVQTPRDLERELGLLRGNVMHVEMGLDAMFAFRPLPELAGYRSPVPGLYLCGASTHPGGGVFGASGKSAAAVLLADRQSRHRRRRFGMSADPW